MARILVENLLTRDPQTGEPLVVLAGEPVPGWVPSSVVEHLTAADAKKAEAPKAPPAASTRGK